MSVGRAIAPYALWLFAAGATAQAFPGDVYVTEKATGSVVNVRGGGDFAAAPRFATGLSAPTGICVASSGRVLVAESGSGEVTDVTSGGDFTGVSGFAEGLETPMDLWCDEDRILVVEVAPGQQGQITDITAGGNFAVAPAFAAGIGTGATALAAEASSGRLFASDANLGRVFDVTGGGVFLSTPPLAANGAGTAGLAVSGERLLAANPGIGKVVDLSTGGDLRTLPVFATVPGVVGLLSSSIGLFAASSSGGAVFEISAGGDFTGAAAFASGLALDPSFAGLARFGGCGDGVLGEGELCDDGNLTEGDGCSALCRVRLCLAHPAPACVGVQRATLKIREKEKGKTVIAGFQLELEGFSEAVTLTDFGDPVFDTTRFDVCVYNAFDNLAAQMLVGRGFDTCGAKQRACWRSIGDKGYKYLDRSLESFGISSIVALAGEAGLGRVEIEGRRRKGHDRLPRITGKLEGNAQATVQVMVSDGRCFGAVLSDVKRADAQRFRASK